MIVTLEPDGTTTPNPSGAPTAWLPDGSGFRIIARFIQASEGLPTYNGLLANYASYNAVLAHYPSYADIQVDGGLAINMDVDIACMVTGCSITNGRNGLFADIQAATLNLSVFDPNGLFDPRSINTVLGPGRRVRAGTWLQVLVWPRTGTGWVPMLTGLVETWARSINAEQTSDVRVSGSDFFAALGAAGYTSNAVAQLTGARVNLMVLYTWNSAWAPVSIVPGTVTLDARTFDNENVLDLTKAAAAVEDGRVFVAPNGTLMFQDATWRTSRHPVVTFLGLGAADFEAGLLACTYNVIAALVPSYNDVMASYLTYNDLRTCTVTGSVVNRIPTVCASAMTAEDSSEDVVNDVTLEYSAPQTPSGFVQGTNAKVVTTGPIQYNAQDVKSQQRYGIRSMRRSDLTPQSHATVLPPLATRWVQRWRDGDATITTVEVDITAAGGNAARILTGMFAGDLVNVVDLVPGAANETDWTVSTAEVASMGWNLNPERFTVTLALDEIRSVAA